jgi:hypothetical protein
MKVKPTNVYEHLRIYYSTNEVNLLHPSMHVIACLYSLYGQACQHNTALLGWWYNTQ